MTATELLPGLSGEARVRQDEHCTAVRHGSRGAYLIGCRCDTARHAYTRYQKQWKYDRAHGRLRKVPVTGAQRRVQALMRIGWDLATISRRLGCRRLNLGRHPAITSSLHLRIAALYDELADHRGPSPTTARHAASRGYLPPITWDEDTIDDPAYDPRAVVDSTVDDVAVERAMSGQAIRLTKPERVEALRRLLIAGVPNSVAAERLHLSGRTANRLMESLLVHRADEVTATASDPVKVAS